MSNGDEATTSPTLLTRARDWRNHPAWIEFFERYDPLLVRWSSGLGLDDDTSTELRQQIWIELSHRIRTFRYDPSQKFRGWLRRLFMCRAIDLLRKRKTIQLISLEEIDSGNRVPDIGEPIEGEDAEGDRESRRLVLLGEAEDALALVRARVDPDTWRAFWVIAIEDRPVREAADLLGKTYAAVYYGYRRVERMLRQEGRRRLADLVDALP